MKAKHIKKLRQKIGKIQKFRILETSSLFGEFIDRKPDYEVYTFSFYRAVQLYMNYYRNRFKQISDHQRAEYFETSEMWGRIQVTDEKGFKTYYR